MPKHCSRSTKKPIPLPLLLVAFVILLALYLAQNYGLISFSPDTASGTASQAVVSAGQSAPSGAATPSGTPQSGNPLKVYYLDVGQADSILVQLPDGRNLLIDAGNNSDGKPVTAYLKQLGINRLDFLVGTHPHEDHIGGLDVVIANFEIGEVLLPLVPDPQIPTTKTYEDVLDALIEKKLSATAAQAGQVLVDDTSAGLKLEVLSPGSGAEYDSLNNYSVVLRLTYGSKCFLFTGDAEAEAESDLLDAGYDVRADVLKVGHHGSSSSTSASFLKAVAPTCAVISCGIDNDYGHPHSETLDSLNKASVTLYRTDKQQTILAECDGRQITFTTGLPSCDGNSK